MNWEVAGEEPLAAAADLLLLPVHPWPTRGPWIERAQRLLDLDLVAALEANQVEGRPGDFLAVPAGTCTSPQLSRSWYALIPAAPQTAIRGRSRARGRRTFVNGVTAASASEATASRSRDRPATPRPSRPTRMAGNAEAHRTTVVHRV